MAITPGPWTPVNGFRTTLLSAGFDLTATSTYKVALVTSSSNISATSTTWAGVTGEVSSGNGYTTGGQEVTMTLAGTTSVTAAFNALVVWTATGGSISGARTAVLYKVGGNVLARCALDTTSGGSDVTAAAGENITLDSDGTPSPVFTLN